MADDEERVADVLLTPTALAEDGDRAEAHGALTLALEDIPLVGPPGLDQGAGTARLCVSASAGGPPIR